MPQVSPTRNHLRMSPTSTSPTRKPIPHGFLPSYKPKQRPIQELSIRELQDTYERNARILSQPAPSTSTYVQRISAEQAQIEERLAELGVDVIQKMMHRTTIKDEAEDMNVDSEPQQVQQPQPSAGPRPISAKQRALQKFSAQIPHPDSKSNIFTYQEAMQIEREAHELDLQRQKELADKQEDKRRRMGLPAQGEKALSKAEQEARMWAFMNYKPSGSDLEDDDDDDSDDDPANWFEDDQDDGRKGQDIIEPDVEDLSSIIRIDDSRIPQSIFYEPPDGE